MLDTLSEGSGSRLNRLALRRLRIPRTEAHASFVVHRREACLYPLTGSALVTDDLDSYAEVTGRRPIETEGVRLDRVQCLRWPAANRAVKVNVQRTGPYALDWLLVEYAAAAWETIPATLHQMRAFINEVGRGAYYREVRELPPPDGYRLHVGETFSPGTTDDQRVPDGVWSSWPPHCTPAERARHAEHEEIMFFLMPRDQYALMVQDGIYCTGEVVERQVAMLYNETVWVPPLGAHEIVAGPALPGQGWIFYAWMYVSFLQKTYNSYASDTSTYLK
jgi:5-deoxy-D-glucuronate isomerase